jgi:DNA-binding MarR family transcriptional regulator
VRLTARGRDTYLRLTRCIQALHRQQWSGLSQTELRELRRLLVTVLGEDASSAKLKALAAGNG